MSVEKSTKPWLYYAIIALVTVLVWGRTAQFEFVWDDHYFIEKNQSVLSLKNIPSMFISLQAQAARAEQFEVFRPLRTAHYALLHWIAGTPTPQPWIYHVANMAWHLAVALLLFSVATVLFKRQEFAAEPMACLIATAFAVHPVTSEVVCWAKSLDDLMATAFVLAATRALLLWEPSAVKSKYPVSALVLFALAMYSKESAVPFALLAVFIFSGFHSLSWKRSAVFASGFLAVALIYAIHRHIVLGHSSQSAPISGSHLQTIIDMFPVVPAYSRLLFGIPPFCIDYGFLKGQHALASTAVVTGITLILGLTCITIWAWKSPSTRLLGFGLLWTGLFLLPVSNIVPMMQYMAERFLYLPLAGWMLAIAALLLRVPKHPVSLTVIGFTILVWTPLTWNREALWRNDLTLFVGSVQQGLRTPRVEKNAVSAWLTQPQFRAALRFDPVTETFLPSADITPEQAAPVLRDLEQAKCVFPNNENISTVMGMIYAISREPGKALSCFQLACQQNPNATRCWINLAMAWHGLNDLEQTEKCLDRALSLEPQHPLALELSARLREETRGQLKAPKQR